MTLADLAPTDFEHPEFFQQVPRRHRHDLGQTVSSECAFLAFAVQGRGQFRDPKIGDGQGGIVVGKEPIDMVGPKFGVIAFDEGAGVDVKERH